MKVAYEINTNVNIKEAFEEEAESLPIQLIKGFRAELKWASWKNLTSVMAKVLQEDDRVMTYGMMGTVPKILFKVKGTLDIELEEEDLSALLETPIAQVANININQLVSSVSAVGEFSHIAYFNEIIMDGEGDECEEVEECLDKLTEIHAEAGDAFFEGHPQWNKILIWLLALCVGNSAEMMIHSDMGSMTTKI